MAPLSQSAPSKVGRIRAPGRDARTRCQCAPPPTACGRDSGYPVTHARTPPPRPPRVRTRVRARVVWRRRAAGAYPDLEALVPASYQGARPETLDSGRNCSTDNLGSLASKGIREVRFAGGTWTFGAERAAVLAVFRTAGLTADALADFYMDSAKVAARTDITGTSEPMIRGRSGYRLDTKTGERVQTVVVWPAAASDVVNVVITNDLPDARIQDAIDAFGDH